MNSDLQVKKSVCTMCHAKCRVLVTSENGRLIKIEEDRTFPRVDRVAPPVSACIRLRSAKEWMYHPDRVNFPLKRAGERGEGKWSRIPWEQAYDEVAEKLERVKAKYGPEAFVLTCGTGRVMRENISRFVYLFGSPNIVGASNVCYGPVVAVATAMLGWNVRHRTIRTIDATGTSLPATKCLFLIGMNPAHSAPALWKSMLDGKKMGVKHIVADPRLTESAALADLWLQLRPSTDTALLMSMIYVIIQEGLYDNEFVTKWCYGFDRLVERAREYPPEKVAQITWLPAEKIKEAARLFAASRPAMIVHGMGTEHLENSIEAIQARFILGAITGNVDIEGGDSIPGPSRARPLTEISGEKLLTTEQKAKQIGSDRFKLLGWPGRELMQKYTLKVWGQECSIASHMALANPSLVYRAMLTGKPYPVRAAMTANSNPLVTQGNARLVYRALKSLDLYVVLDFWRTPSAEMADYIFPITSWLERPILRDMSGTDDELYGGEQALPSVIEGEYEHRTDFEVCRELGMRLGQKEYWPWKSTEEVLDYRLQPLGMTFKEFMDKGGYYFPPRRYKKYEEMGFATPTGKLELYSTIFEKLGYDPLPKYEESHENPLTRPDLAEEFPLILINGGRFHPMFHSEYFNLETTRRRHPNPIVQVNPQTAKNLSILDGDWIWIETVRGRIRMKCQYFQGIDSRVIHCEHGWWFPELPGEEPWLHGVWESNVNVVTDDDPEHCNKLSGGWPVKTALCKIYKCKEYR